MVCRTFKDKQYFPRFALQLMLLLKPRLMLVFCMEPMDMVLVLDMELVLGMVLVLAMLVLAMLPPPLLPDTVSPMLPTV